MKYLHKKTLARIYQSVYEEVYLMDSLVNVTKKLYLQLECNAEYYGIDSEQILYISKERNNYINMLTVLSEKIASLYKLFTDLEQEVSLNENSDNRCR